MPKVSVVMTLHNCEQHIGEAIASALAQTYCDREIVVVDDGSTDGSARVVERFGKAVRYFYQENRGAAAATNKGVELSSGEYVAFLENDDAWLPEKLEKQVAILDAARAIGAVNSDLRYFSEKSEPEHEMIRGYCPEEAFSRLFLKGFNFMLSAVMIRRDVFKATGGFDEGFKAAGLQDVEWYARLMRITNAHWIPEPLTLFRRHGIRVASEVMFQNTQYLLDRLWAGFSEQPDRRRYLLARKVAFLADLGQWKIIQGRTQDGRQHLVHALRLACRERVNLKMAVRASLRLLRAAILANRY